MNITDSTMDYSFSGANTGKGFVSFYDEIFIEEGMAGLYIIKGGPGTGKSTFMKRFAKRSEECGLICERYLCGSDNNSLDGVIVRDNKGRKIGILDGTPPHPKEFRSPGAVGDILNFGTFWDSMALKKRRKEIEHINVEKALCFETAYRYLGAAEKINSHISKLTRGIYLADKGSAAASRLVSSIGQGGNICYRQLSGFTMNGKVMLSPSSVDHLKYVISGNEDVAKLFLADVVRCAAVKGISLQVSRTFLNLNDVEGVYFPEARVCVQIGSDEDADKVINTRRFIDKEAQSLCRQKIRFGNKCRRSLIDGAAESLSAAKVHHFALEDIYKEYMDFDALNSRSEVWYSEILSRLDG